MISTIVEAKAIGATKIYFFIIWNDKNAKRLLPGVGSCDIFLEISSWDRSTCHTALSLDFGTVSAS